MNYYNESEILYLLLTILKVIMFYQEKQVQNEITLDKILLDNNGRIKIL